MKVMSKIKSLWLKYKKLFENQQCPWCGEYCITWAKKRKICYSNLSLGASLYKQECPNCKNKLKLKNVKSSNIVFLLVIITEFLLAIILHNRNFYKISIIVLIFLLIFIEAYATPAAKIVKNLK